MSAMEVKYRTLRIVRWEIKVVQLSGRSGRNNFHKSVARFRTILVLAIIFPWRGRSNEEILSHEQLSTNIYV